MLLAVWIALGVAVAATAGGAMLAGLSGLRGWRAFRRVSGAVTGGLDDLATAAAATGAHAAASVEHAGALADATARLDRALAELRVLGRAAKRARAGVRSPLPRK